MAIVLFLISIDTRVCLPTFLHMSSTMCLCRTEQIKMLTGFTAKPELLQRITWLCLNHHEKILLIDTVRAFHFGNNFIVEVKLVFSVLDGSQTVTWECKNLGAASHVIQRKFGTMGHSTIKHNTIMVIKCTRCM